MMPGTIVHKLKDPIDGLVLDIEEADVVSVALEDIGAVG